MSLDLAPHFQRQPLFGLPVDTRTLCLQGGLALIFLQDAGSLHTRAMARALESAHEPLELADVALLAVVRGTRSAALDLVTRECLVYPVIHDPEEQLYQAWEVRKGRLGRRPAAFVVGLDSEIRWQWRPRSPVARLDGATLAAAALAPG